MAADFSSLPGHITEKIFVNLSCIKSTLTCTSVCKSWYALIKSPQFIEFHLSNPNNNKRELSLCSYSEDHPRFSVQYNDCGTLRTYHDIKFPRNIERVSIIGSINGIICFKFTTKFDVRPRIICLWNPSIRKFKDLPKPKFYEKDAGYGFWFDSKANDYKVVKINPTKTSKVEVYCLSTNSWNLITTRGPYLGMYDGDLIVHVNGTLYWLWGHLTWKFISFDINTGKFKENVIWLEEKGKSRFVLLTSEAHSHSLTDLFVLRYECIPCGKYVTRDVRVFDGDLNQLYTIEFEGSETGASLIGVRNNSSELLFQRNKHPQILVCNVEDLKFKDFCSSSLRCISWMRPFVETLVLLNDGDSDYWTGDATAPC
ncbi:putative F-box protein At3g20705 [Apium graveolens]|uniref:putative F-box protein At3g20705 n=1 Tax=Apium graveolens TaxID=4045 RepID=UPI003D78BF43